MAEIIDIADAEPAPSVQSERRDRELARRAERKTTPPLASPFSTKVVGVTNYADYPKGLHDIADAHASVRPQWIELQRQPDNERDLNAIAILWQGIHIGFLNKVISFRLAPELDAGITWLARVEEVAGDEDMPGIHIRMKRDD